MECQRSLLQMGVVSAYRRTKMFQRVELEVNTNRRERQRAPGI